MTAPPPTQDLYGWYDDPKRRADDPAFDPPHDAPCPFCGLPLRTDDVRTHGLMAAANPSRSYFYRTHRSCDDAAGETASQAVFDAVIDRIEHDGQPM